MSKAISPNDLQAAAIEHMLDGKKPRTTDDWTLLANFWAANIAGGLEVSAVPLIGMLFNCPLSKEVLVEIAKFQATRKQEAA